MLLFIGLLYLPQGAWLGMMRHPHRAADPSFGRRGPQRWVGGWDLSIALFFDALLDD